MTQALSLANASRRWCVSVVARIHAEQLIQIRGPRVKFGRLSRDVLASGVAGGNCSAFLRQLPQLIDALDDYGAFECGATTERSML